MTILARYPTIATTIKSSINVKPFGPLIMPYIITCYFEIEFM
jgi:hypothetical protein